MMKIGLLCIWQLQSEVRRSAEKYQVACVACDRSKQTLVSIEQVTLSSTAGDSAVASFSADKQESLNRATDEVPMIPSPFIMLVNFYNNNHFIAITQVSLCLPA